MEKKNKPKNKKRKVFNIKLWLHDLKTVIHKDLISTKRVKKYFLAGIIPPIVILIVFSSFDVINNPETYNVMVVDDDNTEYSNIMVNYIKNITSEFAPWFNVIPIDSYQEAKIKMDNYGVLGLIYIPTGFQANITSNSTNIKGTLYLTVQNINDDYVKNYIQRLDEAVLTFNQHIHLSNGHVDDFELIAKKSYVINQNVSLIKGTVIGVLGVYGIVCGLLYGGLNIAKEYNDNTMIEITISPIKRSAYIASKQLIAIILGSLVITIFSLILFLIFNIKFRGNLGVVILAFLLSTWFHTCLGGLIGLKIKQTMNVMLITIVMAIFFWFFAGGFAPTRMLGETVYDISRFIPSTYWMEILFSETFLPNSLYVLPRLGILAISSIGLTIIFWILISKEGFKL
ncbi:MAG: ABC transporter permease [Promethearchaeota archaeon]